MGAQDIVDTWRSYLKNDILTGLRRPLVEALADFSAAVAQAGHCRSSNVATQVVGAAKPASQRRRWERWLANPHFDAVAVQDRLTRAIWECWPSPRAQLILDETPKANDLRCLRVSIAYRKRALPLVQVCYAPKHPPRPMPQLVRDLLARAIRHRPAGVEL